MTIAARRRTLLWDLDGGQRAPIGEYAPSSPAARAFAELWVNVERAIAKAA